MTEKGCCPKCNQPIDGHRFTTVADPKNPAIERIVLGLCGPLPPYPKEAKA